MSIDNEILQEFLVEAGELFDQLNDQFIELEKSPEDSDLINAIFRAYHTIKGGAGFMKLTPMVEICHRAEDAINEVRQGERQVTEEMVDIMFQVLDELDGMFSTVRAGEELADANADLLQQLDRLLAQKAVPSIPGKSDADDTGDAAASVTAASDAASAETDASLDNEVQNHTAEPDMDDEFEAMLCATNNEMSNSSDLISDDEFEAALDNIHGKGKHSASVASHSATTADNQVSAQPSATSDLITDDEFEAALDNLHGKGKGPTVVAEDVAEPDSKTETEATAPVEKETTSNKTTPVKTEKSQVEATVRVDTARLDNLMNLVGELVLVRNRLSTLKNSINDDNVSDAIASLELVSAELQNSVMKTRMQPIKKVFSRFPRVIRDLARKLKKDINLELIGEETDLDKSLVEALADPLIHLVRNAADHGIESPDERFQSGKLRQGKVTLKAKQEGDQILLTVSDDGKGMDHEKLRSIAVEKGMMSEEEASQLTAKEAYNLIFAPGFSTKTEVSDVSGRGVGMDVVKTRINELSGNLEIDSTPGEGSIISIYLPLTLAILPTLMVKLNQYQFALPLSNVLEAFNMQPGQINVVDGQEVIRVRDKPLPLYFLNPWLVNGDNFNGAKASQKVIVIQMGNQRFCLVVDHIAGQEEVVIKPLGSMLCNTQGFAGATITGDGSIALIIDMPGLIAAYASNGMMY